MPRKRKTENDQERQDRLKREATQADKNAAAEDDAMDAMVRRSINSHGP